MSAIVLEEQPVGLDVNRDAANPSLVVFCRNRIEKLRLDGSDRVSTTVGFTIAQGCASEGSVACLDEHGSLVVFPVRESVSITPVEATLLALTAVEEGPVAVTATRRELKWWRGSAPEAVGIRGETTALAATAHEGRPYAMIGYAAGLVRVLDLEKKQFGEPVAEHQGAVRSVRAAVVEGNPVVISTGADQVIRVTPMLGKPVPQKRTAPPASRMLSDEPVLDEKTGDRLDFKAYADALASLIDNPKTKTPLVLAINAPWGAGKTTLGRMIETRLKGSFTAAAHATCWFNAWMHDDAASLASAFAGAIAQEANRQRGWLRRMSSPLPLSLLDPSSRRRRRLLFWIPLLATALGLGFYLLSRLPGEALADLAKVRPDPFWLSVPGLFVIVGKLLASMLETAKGVSGFVANPQAAAASGSMMQVHKQLGELLASATPTGGRFVIFIDDIERCQAPRSVEVLEVVNQLLAHENVVTVLMADMPAVAAAAEIKYEKLAAKYQPSGSLEGYGASYLQKMIQIQFDLPVHPPSKMRDLIGDLLKEEAPASSEPVKRSVFDWVREVWAAGGHPDRWVQGYSPATDFRALVGRGRWPEWPGRFLFWTAVLLPRWTSSLMDRLARKPAGSAWSRNAWVRYLGMAMGAVAVAFVLVAITLIVEGYRQFAKNTLSGGFQAWQLMASVPATAVLTAMSWELGRAGALGMSRIVSRVQPVIREMAIGYGGLVGGMAPLAALAFAIDAYTKGAPPLVPLDLLGQLLAGSLAWIGVLAFARGRWQRRFDEQALSGLSEVARDPALESIGDIRRAVYERTGHDLDEDAVARHVRLALADDSAVRRLAEGEAMKSLAPLPRSAKRTINRLRLYLLLAFERGLLRPGSAVTPEHIGRWAVLCERWPELMRAVAVRPAVLGELEGEKSRDAFRQLARRVAEAYESDDPLWDFCHGDTALGPVAESLVYFQTPNAPSAQSR